jgi:N-acetylmuramoyl-L-alanine amidase
LNVAQSIDTLASMNKYLKTTILIVLVSLFVQGQNTAFADNLESWNVLIDSVNIGSVQVRQNGDVSFIDALTLSDKLGISYFRDEEKRFVFSFPDSPVIFVADGCFAQIGVEIIHFPLPAFLEGVRFFIPEEPFFEVVTALAPGVISIEPAEKTIRYSKPSSDLYLVDLNISENDWKYRFTFNRYLEGSIELVDSTHINLLVPEASIIPDDPIFQDLNLQNTVHVNGIGNVAKITVPKTIRSARLEGPDAGNTMTLHVIVAGEDGDDDPVAYGDQSIFDALAADQEKWKIDKIIIDPGHGGKDPGAVGRRKTYEKNIVLKIGLALRDEIRRRTDIDVVMTRETDILIPLGERGRIANRENGKLFISLHINGSTSKKAHGQSTYFLSPARTERAMRVALKENSVIKYEEKKEGYPDLNDENFILLAMAQSQFAKESEAFASIIQNKLHKRTKLRNRGVDQAGFYVLIGASMPAVLVESAFITNPREENLLRTKKFQNQIAIGICDAIVEFVAKYEGR